MAQVRPINGTNDMYPVLNRGTQAQIWGETQIFSDTLPEPLWVYSYKTKKKFIIRIYGIKIVVAALIIY